MDRLFPDRTALDDDEALDAALRDLSRREHGRPWVLANMVASVDGAIEVDGLSAALGGAGDQRLFSAIRALADVVVVGAGTFRVEEYGPPSDEAATQARRHSHGVAGVLRLAIVTRSLDLDLDAPAFTSPTSRPIVVTVARADAARRAAVERVADVIEAGDDDVDLARALAALHDGGARVVLAEGGPRLNGQLLAADLLDEVFVTVSPTLVGGDGSRLARGEGPGELRRLALVHALVDGDELFLRYRRPR